MKIIPGTEQDYKTWKDNNANDGYGARIFSYAEDWANELEKIMEENGIDQNDPIAVLQTIIDSAASASHKCDTDGITGFMYGAAVTTLSRH